MRQTSIIARISFSTDSEKADIPRNIRSVTVAPLEARVSVFLRSSHRFLPGGGETCTLPLDTQVVEPKKPYVPRLGDPSLTYFRPVFFIGSFCLTALPGLGAILSFFLCVLVRGPASAA